MKTAPDLEVEPTIEPDSQRVKDWLSTVVRRVREDQEARASWVQSRAHFFSRRYCLEWRNPTFPWVNSSNVVIPLIDKKIDELKPQYVNIIAASNPPVTAQAAMPEYQRKTKNVELFFEWLVHHGSPQFMEETILAVDDCLETGRGILKTYWKYETRTTPTYLTAARLPERLKRLIVAQRGEEEANRMFIAAGGQGGAIVITPREFDGLREQISAVVQAEFDLDEDEPRDKKALSDLMAWLRSGAKEPLRFQSRDVVTNVPVIRAINPIDFIVPENATSCIEEHERITEVMYFTKQQLMANAIDQKLNTKVLDDMIRKRGSGTEMKLAAKGANWQKVLVDIRQDAREGIISGDDDLFEIWKISTWMSPSEGAPERKVVVLVPADTVNAPLKIKVHNRPNGKWGISSFCFEHNKRRWYSPRGVPEKLDDIEAEFTAQHRAKLNRMAIVNAPTMKYRPGRHINPNTSKFVPGQMYPTSDPSGDVIPMEFSNMDVSFDNEMQMLQVYAESYLGGQDYSLTGNSTLSEARTATEINAVQSQARASLSMRGLLFKLCYNEIWEEFFNLWHAVGPDQVYVKVTGGDEPIRLTKEELQGKFLLTCTGTIGSSDPVLEAQKAQARIIILAQLKSLLEPRFEVNLGEAVIDWMEKDNIRLMKRVLRERSPEELQQIQQQQQQAQAQQEQQELAMASAGGKPSSVGKSGPSAPQVAAIPPLGARS